MKTRLRYLLRERDTRGMIGEQVLSVYRDLGVVPKVGREDNFNKTPEDLSLYKLVLPGDVVVNKMKAWQGSIAVSDHRGIVSGDYLVCSVIADVYLPYLHHLLRSQPMVAEYVIRSKGIRPSQWRLYWDDLADIQVDLPPLPTQRAIADYLDAETARIDALIEKKRRMVELLDEHVQAVRDDWTAEQFDAWGSVPFRRRITKVEQGWSPQCEAVEATPDEWGVLKTSAVSTGVFNPASNKRLPAEVEPDLRWEVRDGDLLAVRGSGSLRLVGKFAVARTDGRRLMLSDLTYRLVTHSSHTEYLAAVLASRRLRDLLESMVRNDVGQTLKVRVDDLKELPIPNVPVNEQARLLAALMERLVGIDQVVATLADQIDLLVERRQTLITEAVTGELTIPGVAA